MFWRKEDLRYTKSAYREVAKFNLAQDEILLCLNMGLDSGEKRKEGIIEKCLTHQNKTLKVVVAESWDHVEKRIVWRVIHIGQIGKN